MTCVRKGSAPSNAADGVLVWERAAEEDCAHQLVFTGELGLAGWSSPSHHRAYWDDSTRAHRRLRALLERASDGVLPTLMNRSERTLSAQLIPDVAAIADEGWRDAFIERIFEPIAAEGSTRLGTLRSGVLEELLVNQLRHCPPGSALEVQLSQVGEELRLVLRDNAGAFDAPALAEVMERLSKEQGHTVQQGGAGAGLGLVMVLDSCSLLELVLDPGRSTQIAVEFPLTGSIGALRRQGKSLSVYVVEDS